MTGSFHSPQISTTEYQPFFNSIKERIASSRLKAQRSANTVLIELYLSIGKYIVEKQEHANWGSAVIDQLAKDLKRVIPEKGLENQTFLL